MISLERLLALAETKTQVFGDVTTCLLVKRVVAVLALV